MENHDEKIKDMVESVLPSTARKAARYRRRLAHKQARARQRGMLAAVKGAGYDDAVADFREGRRKSALHWMVLDRRGADNVGALTRWAADVVEADPNLREAPLHVQVAHFAGILPADLIGQHALQHIEWALKYRAERPCWSQRRAAALARAAVRQQDLVAALRDLMAAGRHGDFNAALRREFAEQIAADPSHDPKSFPVRFLLGWHDIDAFADEMAGVDWVRDLGRTLA